MTLKTILAAVGRFPQDDAVLTRALEIASVQRARLCIVHVIEIPGIDPDIGDRTTLHGQAAIAVRDRIEAALARAGVDASDADIRIEAGSPALRLIAVCEDLQPGLIVMRAHQKDRIADRILGSNPERMIAAGLAPVLVVKRPVARPYGRILFATDGTDDAERGLAFVADLLPGAALHLVQAVHVPGPLQEAMLRVGTERAALDGHLQALERNARDHLRGLAAGVAPRATTRVLHGVPTTALERATRRPRVDLLALGPGRTSLIRRAFIGSVTRRLLRDAACDVLICHPLPDGNPVG